MNIKFLSLDTADAEARAVWCDPAVDMVVVRCPDGLHLVFGAPLAGLRVLASGGDKELGIVITVNPDGWVVYPEGPFPPISVSSWIEVLENL